MLNKILDIIFPQKCLGCGEKNEILCEKCLDPNHIIDIKKVGNVFSISNYNNPVIKKSISLFKYKGVKNISEKLSDLTYTALEKENILKEFNEVIVIPVPTSKKRLRGRGFNQSELLSKHIVRKIKSENNKMSVTMHNNVLYKKIHTDAQVKTHNKKERLENLKDSFGFRNDENIKNKKIVVIDDVITTGATIHEATKTLKKAGAKKVTGLIVARQNKL